MTNIRILLSSILEEKIESAIPMTKQLKTFAAKVAHGKIPSENCFTPIETPNRARLPNPPPRKINSAV